MGHDTESKTTRETKNQPLALHLGFAGSRKLWPEDWAEDQRQAAHDRLVKLLCEEIKSLKAKLCLEGTGCEDDQACHFWVGISRVAFFRKSESAMAAANAIFHTLHNHILSLRTASVNRFDLRMNSGFDNY